MLIPHVERNPNYFEDTEKTIKKEKNYRNFQIYQKPKQKKEQPKPPKKLKTRELFDFLNIWDCEIGKRHNYLTQFNHFLIQKRETIELEEIEKKMKKPDFIKFFKYLKEKEDKSDDELFEHDVNLQIAFTAKQRRDLNAQERLKKKHKFPQARPKDILLPASFNPNFQIPTPSPDDFVIVTHFYNQYLEQPNKSIPKSILCSYMLENRKFCDAYNINKNLLEDQLNEFPTQFEEEITLEEFINFILYPKILIIKDNYEQNLLKSVKGNQEFEESQKSLLLKIYDEFNLDCEEKVNPIKLISSIRTRYETRIYLFDTFISFRDINKNIPFEKWLYEFEVYCQRLELEYISKSYFKEWQNQLFEIPNKFIILQSSQISKKRKYDKLFENEEICLQSNFFSELEKIFNQIRKSNERFSQKKLVVDNLIANEEFSRKFFKMKVRKEKTNQLPIETVEETVNRLQQEADEYIDLDELIDFFTVRGRPLILSQKLKQQYTINKKQKENPIENNKFGAINKIDNGFFLITVPDSRKENENQVKSIRQKEVEKMLIDKEKDLLKEINTKFQANPVPWFVKEPLYDQLNREREERRERIKEESKARLMQSMMEPKSFEKQKKEIQVPEQEIEFKFMSRPVPDSIRDPRFQMIMEEQRSRSKSNVEKKKAQWADYFANSTQLQKSLEREEIRKSLKRVQNKKKYKPESFEKFRAKSLPNFERLHTIFENIIASKKKSFVPTIPCQTNLSITNRTVDCSMLDLGNQSNMKGKQKIADIDNRLNKILKSSRPNIIKTKSTASISKYRRKQRYEKEYKQQLINDELEQWKEERKQLLPKGMKINNPAAEQQKLLDNELEDLVKWKKKYHKNLDKDYQNDLKKMQKRVQKRRLLRFQSNNLDDQEDSSSQSSKSSDRSQQVHHIDKFL
ncbi:unnamed protein product [Paramecium pentaurelia]|uniref:Uncharacterized protein n=1 Tax=Paramecium pentaurelia TaxID=43138 RepID=A0A8S1X921_9CILI|nr:unnamed protein product [Paramecium pentaurelia]